MKNIIGINLSHDSGVCLISGSELIIAINEERLSRKKVDHRFPKNTLKYVSELAESKGIKIDTIAYSYSSKEDTYTIDMIINDNKRNIFYHFKRFIVYFVAGLLPIYNNYLNRKGKEKVENMICEYFTYDVPVIRIDHHLSHAASAYYTSTFNDSDTLVFTSDGSGDGKSACIYKPVNNKLKLVDYIPMTDTLGDIYTFVTVALGFRAYRHEGKITGLAAFGNYKNSIEFFNSLFTFNEDETKYILNVSKLKLLLFYLNLRNLYSTVLFARLEWKKDLKRTYFLKKITKDSKKYSKEDFAAGVQKNLEEIATVWIRNNINKYSTQPQNVALSGGVFANVKLNQRIRELDNVKNILIHPNMGDGGLALGAALAYLNCIENENVRIALDNVYWGLEYTDKEVEEAIKASGLNYTILEAPEKFVAECLKEKKVVAIFQGKVEYGPRALCNRSIICNATDPTINDWLNKRLRRTEFMPFAPIIRFEDAMDYFEKFGYEKAKADEFMTTTYNVTEKMKNEGPAAVHIDGTARPQLVKKNINPFLHEILTKYKELTGNSVLINTSFNMHEEPIVCSPNDALRSFKAGELDVIVLNNKYLIMSDD